MVESSQTRDRIRVLCIDRQFPTHCPTGEVPILLFFDHPLEQGAIDIRSQLVLGYGAGEGDGGG